MCVLFISPTVQVKGFKILIVCVKESGKFNLRKNERWDSAKAVC